MSIISEMSNDDFANYLEMLSTDFAESGAEATAEDYAEAARRIRKLTSTDFTSTDNQRRITEAIFLLNQWLKENVGHPGIKRLPKWTSIEQARNLLTHIGE